jgi:hypothetical protein
MKRKILLACSLLLIVAVLSTGILAGCAGETTTETVTKTNTSTVTTTAQGVTTTVTATATTTAAGATVTQTVGAGSTATVTVTQTATTTKTVTTGGGTELLTVMSPIVADHMVERVPLIPRLDTLEGKSIYLIDVNWGSGDGHGAFSFLTVTAEWLEDEYNCTTHVVKQASSYFGGDPDLFQEASENADAVIYGISG